MFKFIGAAVVYGFAAYGLFVWLDKGKEEIRAAKDQKNN